MAFSGGLEHANHLFDLASETLGPRVSGLVLRSASSGIEGVLYDAFVFQLGYGERYGNLEAGILLPGGRMLTAPFGRPFTQNSDDDAVRSVLAQMDKWARLRLPDAYLEQFGDSTLRTDERSARGGSQPPADTPYFAQITYHESARVPVRVFRVVEGVDEQYRKAPQGWMPDDGMLREDRLGQKDHEIWPITRRQAGEVIRMIESGQYHPIETPGLDSTP